jgi:hypothetical protein
MPVLSMKKQRGALKNRYKPSPACRCAACTDFCLRPGWWTVEEAEAAYDAGLAGRMMLEVSPELTFGVLSPAFKGCEAKLALQHYAENGCCFLEDGLCGLHDSGFQPLECRVCHHSRPGVGRRCHADIETDWHTARGQALVEKWALQFNVLKRYGLR